MSETKNKNKRRLSFTLSLFPTNNNSFQTFTKIKSPKIFEDYSNGVVGLGIVAAMHDGIPQDPLLANNKSAILAISPKSPKPVPIFRKNPSFEKMEMSEEYTRVISHVGKNLVKKREYFVGDLLGVTEDLVDNNYSFTVGQSGQLASNGWTVDFLNSCFLCKKKLHGLDIFMYRGETAFCSAECRYKQIFADEHGKCGSSMVMNPTDSFQCFSGVTAT